VAVLVLERDPGLPPQDVAAGVPVRRLPLRGRLGTYPRALLGTWRALRRHEPFDLMHVHLPLAGLGALLGDGARRTPRVYTYHGPWHLEMATELRAKPLRAPLRALYRPYVDLLCRGLRWWQGQVMRRCDRVTVLSEHSRRQIAAIFPFVPPAHIVRIPDGVDRERFRPAADRAAVRTRLGLPLAATILLTVRRLVPRMGLENLLQAVAQLRAGLDDLYLVVGGRGRLEGDLRALAERLGIAGQIRFTGFIPDQDLPAYYQAADLFVLPTLALENFGLIILEALAAGLPVVGTPVDAIPEILGPCDPRFLAPATDAAALAKGIHRGLAIARQEGAELGERCRAFVATHYDWEQVVDRYEALYTELLASAHRRR
jgi:glycosyltransferase involved in cell wall biosynthesis